MAYPDIQEVGVMAGLCTNQVFRSQRATLTSASNAGTSTKGPITVAKATEDPRPNAAMATAMARSKLLLAAVKDARWFFHNPPRSIYP